LEDEELLERYDGNTAPYALQLNRTENIDCACKRGVGSLVNHKAFSYANARLTKNNQGVAFVSAMKNIKNNCEIFVTYGTDYLFNEPGVSYRTVNTR
jgi:dTDP-4-amino-4,6-dideoxygalactose transaminase